MFKKLQEKIDVLKAPVVVGLDPVLDYVPREMIEESFALKGENLEGAAEAIFRFNKAIVDAIYDICPCVKPQIAMYERYGVPGVLAYKNTVDYCHEKGLYVIGDIKRGDIGSTSMAYAQGHLGAVRIGEKDFFPFDEDFATVNPYLGIDGVKPFLEVCAKYGRGIFVLVKTSNPSSGDFQDKKIDEEPLYEVVAKKVFEWSKEYGTAIGAVAGATYPEVGKRLREILPESMFLIPGYGAQGGGAKDIAPFLDANKKGIIVNSSRGIICAYRNDKYKDCKGDVGKAARAALTDMREDLGGI